MATLMIVKPAIIKIKNLRLRTYIGIKEDEINNQQDIIINASIHYDAEQAIISNAINDALNYKTATKKIIQHVENNHFTLLERLTKEVLDIIFEEPHTLYAEVEIDKPHALRFADSVSMQLCATRK